MHVVIVGPGALGSLLTARLSLGPVGRGGGGSDEDFSVSLLDYKPLRAQKLARSGLFIEDELGTRQCIPAVTSAPEVCAGAEIVILCVKATALPAALDRICSFLAPEQILLGMQNGIAHLELLMATGCIAGAGITTEGATLLGPGRVRHGGAGLTRLGLLAPAPAAAGARLARLAAMLNAAGMATRITDAPRKHVWAKLFINAGINGLTALLGCPNGGLLESAETRERLTQAVREAEAVARAAGISIDEDPVAATFRVCQATKDNISSMLQDIRNHRNTEIDAINGAVAAAGRRLGVPTPMNDELVQQIRALEAAFAGPEEQR